jgi:hypothetical protein
VVISIDQPVQLDTDLSELRNQIQRTVRTECVNVAVRFPEKSILRSSSVADLVLSAGLVHSISGTFALISPSDDMRRVLKALGVGNLIMIVNGLRTGISV